LLLAAGEQQRTRLEIPSRVLFGGVVFCSRGRPITTSAPANRPNAHLQRTDDALTMTSTVQRGILRRPGMIDRIVVMTISWLSALIIYDGWDVLRFIDVAAIILGPIAAIFAAHVFAGTLTERVRLGRGLTRRERVALIGGESQFLLLALPPLALLAVLAALGVSYARVIQVIIGVGIASLGFWGGLAGHRAGLTGLRLVLCVAGGLGLGALTLLLAAILQPGTKPFAP
jgi:hypothetical protein